MKLRAPAYPLITVDPYFSIWSMNDRLNQDDTRFWTGDRTMMLGRAIIDGVTYVFMGSAKELGQPAMAQISVEVTTFTTEYVFEASGVRLTARFTTPILPDDFKMISRPVSYLHIDICSIDNLEHTVEVEVKASEEFCMENYEDLAVTVGDVFIAEDISAMRIGGTEQAILGKSGDGIGIDWGYFYLAVKDGSVTRDDELKRVCLSARKTLNTAKQNEALFAFAYDDIKSIVYFGEQLNAYWKEQGNTIQQEIAAAYGEYEALMNRCADFHARLVSEAKEAGGEKYAELLVLAMRQVMAAHKLVVDTQGKILYISKECFSNGCAATADVSYPSIPLFLIYNTELAKGMMRPIFRYASSEQWPYPFAPHDVGRYPILNGQAYSRGTELGHQMPVEECGNMLLMATATALAERSTDFIKEHRALLDLWAEYLFEHGADPESQVTSDDFAGHIAHNCNLALKAMMALGGYAKICEMLGEQALAEKYGTAAQKMANDWVENAPNGDGSYRLAFDRPNSYSMKYNAVWDTIFGLGLLPSGVMASELESYIERANPYGMPLLDTSDFTNSGWIAWTATMAGTKDLFEKMMAPVWLAFHISPSRVPLADWYSSITSIKLAGQHRTVQGALFMKLLDYKGLCHF